MRKEGKRKALAALVCGSMLTVALVGGTLAYLTDTDSDVNVMTLGNVSIEQHEQQLAEDGVTKEPFEQGKGLYPGTDVSKIVTVENTGKSDVYFRTLIALEDIDSETFEVGFPIDEFSGYTWSWGAPEATIVLDGTTYQVYEAVYKSALKAGETSPASLTKVEFASSCTNEDMELLGNTYEILVLSQAGQIEGFEAVGAAGALDTMFGEVNAENATKWFSGDEFAIPTAVATADELSEALAAGESVYLTEDIILTEAITISADASMTLNLNGNDITGTFANPVSLITNNGDLTIEGEGEISVTFSGTVNDGVAANAISNRGNLTINGGTIKNTNTISNSDQIGYAIDNYNGSKLTINGGEITASGSIYYDGIRLFCGSNETVVTVNGGEISSIWAQNPSANKATEVKGTVILNGGNLAATYYENYTTVKVLDGITATVTPYGAGSDNTTSKTQAGYTVYSFVH